MKRILACSTILMTLCAVVLLSSCNKEPVNGNNGVTEVYSYEFDFSAEGNEAIASATVEQMVSILKEKGVSTFSVHSKGIGLSYNVNSSQDDRIARKLFLDAKEILSKQSLKAGTKLSLDLLRKVANVYENVDSYYQCGLENEQSSSSVSFANEKTLKRSKEIKLSTDLSSVNLVPVFVKGDGSVEVATGYSLGITVATSHVITYRVYATGTMVVIAEGEGTTEALISIKNESKEVIATEKVTFKVDGQFVELQKPGVSNSSVYSAGIYHEEGHGYNIVLSMSQDIYVSTVDDADDIHSLLFIDIPEDAMDRRVSISRKLDTDSWKFAIGAQNTGLGDSFCYTNDNSDLSGSYCEVYRYDDRLMIDCKFMKDKRIKFYGTYREIDHYIWSNKK